MTVTPPAERIVLFVVKAAYVVSVSDISNIVNMMIPVILRLIFLTLSCFTLMFLMLS